MTGMVLARAHGGERGAGALAREMPEKKEDRVGTAASAVRGAVPVGAVGAISVMGILQQLASFCSEKILTHCVFELKSLSDTARKVTSAG